MREAFEPKVEVILEKYCLNVMKAKTDEEIEILKEEAIMTLNEYGLEEEMIQRFFSAADGMIEHYSTAENLLSQMIVKYCTNILRAKDEEELILVKQEMMISLREVGFGDTTIQSFFVKADEMVENEDIIMQEDGTIMVFDQMYGVLNTELRAPMNSQPNENMNRIGGSFLIGIGLTALISALALKQKMFKQKKKEENERSR